MASPAIGAKSYMQWGRESTWGTAVTATKRLGILKSTLKQDLKLVRDQRMTGSRLPQDIYVVRERAVGQIELYCTYNDLMMFFDGAMGTATFGSNGGTTTGANPYTHTWNDGKEFFNSYTIEIVEGNIPANKCSRVKGAKIVGLTLKGEASDIVRVTLDIVGKQFEMNQTPTPALTANTQLLVLTSHVNTFADGSGDAAADIVLKSFECNVNPNLNAERDICGSAYIGEPIGNGLTMASMKFRKEFRTKTAFDAAIAMTSFNPSLPLLVSASQSLTFQMPTAKVVNESHGLDDFGIGYQEMELESIITSGSPDTGAQITLVNAQATITT